MLILIDLQSARRAFNPKRALYHLQHYVRLAELAGYDVITSQTRHKPDIYIGEVDTFYRGYDLPECFKVCVSLSDRLFRETGQPYKSFRYGSVLGKCDLYATVNHSKALSDFLPITHAPSPEFIDYLIEHNLYEAFLSDDISKIRNKLARSKRSKLGFIGSPSPTTTRLNAANQVNGDLIWTTSLAIDKYIDLMGSYHACLDLRGFGDKSIRFTEACLLGNLIVRLETISQYSPTLCNKHNCLMGSTWNDIDWSFEETNWSRYILQATADYLAGWSVKAQFRKIISRYENRK